MGFVDAGVWRFFNTIVKDNTLQSMTAMNPFDWQKAIDTYYPRGRRARDILLTHSRCVADMAISLAASHGLPLEEADVECAAMVHDIGIIATDAPGIDCHGHLPYLCHGPAGADMLRSLGAPERYALVAERHTGAGLQPQEIAAAGLPLPAGRCYMPSSLLERLICYADCFYSKGADMEALKQRKPLERVRASMARFGAGVLERFEALHGEFGGA